MSAQQMFHFSGPQVAAWGFLMKTTFSQEICLYFEYNMTDNKSQYFFVF